MACLNHLRTWSLKSLKIESPIITFDSFLLSPFLETCSLLKSVKDFVSQFIIEFQINQKEMMLKKCIFYEHVIASDISLWHTVWHLVWHIYWRYKNYIFYGYCLLKILEKSDICQNLWCLGFWMVVYQALLFRKGANRLYRWL